MFRKDALEVRDVAKEFREGNDTIRAHYNANLKIREGEIVGLLGPNGAGMIPLISATFAFARFFLLLFGISLGMIHLALIFPHGENAIFLVWTLPH